MPWNNTVTFTMDNAQFNPTLLYLLVYGHEEKICKYFLKYPNGDFLLRHLSKSKLLSLMPNNVKKRMGLPMSRRVFKWGSFSLV